MPPPLTNALMTTAAVIDRLVHHSVILEMTGTSVRADAAEQAQCSFARWNMMSTRFSRMPRIATSAARPIARSVTGRPQARWRPASRRGKPRFVTPIDQLCTTKEELSPDLRAQILALGAEAVPALLEILDDEDLGASESAAEGWPPIHAVSLLAEIGAPEAIGPMLEALASASWEEILHSQLVVRLPVFGPAVVEPALAILASEEASSARHSLCCVLSKVGVRDERIFGALCALFDEDEALGAMCLSDYGDERALPILEGAIEDFAPDFDDPESILKLQNLVSAYEMLGRHLPDDLRAHVERIRQDWAARSEARSAPAASGASKKTGRNDPCPCGSGKKFKKCCLGKAPAGPGIVASPGISREKLAIAADYFRDKDAGRGPAQQFVAFAQPLLDVTDGTKATTEHALTCAQFLWNVAHTRDPEQREAMLGKLLSDLPGEDREEFEQVARKMIRRQLDKLPAQ